MSSDATAVDATLRDEALTDLDRALAQVHDPTRPLWRQLKASAQLRTRGDDALTADILSGLDAPARLRALAYAASARRLPAPPGPAWRGAAPSAAMTGAVRRALAGLPRPPAAPAELALALWSDLDGALEGLLADRGGSAHAALEQAILWGVPSDARVGAAAIDRVIGVGSIIADQLRATLVKCHLDEVAAALDVAAGIGLASVRLHALFELTVAVHPSAPDPALRRALAEAGAAAYQATADEELWPGAADLQLAGILARTDPASSEVVATLLARAGPVLERTTHPEVRARVHRLALLATTAVGIAAWRERLEAIVSDRHLLRDPAQRAHLLFEVAASTAWFGDVGKRGDALAQVTDLVARIPQPGVRALVAAELARRTQGVTGRSPSVWIGEARKGITTPPFDAQLLPKTLRLLAETAPREVLSLVRALPRAEDRVIGAMMVAEVAAGVRDA